LGDCNAFRRGGGIGVCDFRVIGDLVVGFSGDIGRIGGGFGVVSGLLGKGGDG